MEMAQGKLLRYLSVKESAEIYQAYGIRLQDQPKNTRPCIVSSGLPDILLPVNSKEKLYNAIQKRDEVIRISKEFQVIGVHMFCYVSSPKVTAYCRNFAPLYGIDEEAATGTSNGALTYYLYNNGLIRENCINTFAQGESMGKSSIILSRIINGKILIGGEAVVSVSGYIRLNA
jgi:PhzF family phenazine biosynthesis protein